MAAYRLHPWRPKGDIMNRIALAELDSARLDTICGGFDLNAAHRAGMTQMETGRVPPSYQPPGSASSLRPGAATQCLLQPATPGPLGYAIGFGRNAYQQLTQPQPPTNGR